MSDVDLDAIRDEFLAMRAQLHSVHLATLSEDNIAQASYAPCQWMDNICYLFLSELAGHTRNLAANPAVGLMVIDDEENTRNPFARRRIILQAKAYHVPRDTNLFSTVLSGFHDRFGGIIDLLESLPDFHLFRVLPQSGRFIKGFAQAYELTGAELDQPVPVTLGKN